MFVFPLLSYTKEIVLYIVFSPAFVTEQYILEMKLRWCIDVPQSFCMVAEHATGWKCPRLYNQSF